MPHPFPSIALPARMRRNAPSATYLCVLALLIAPPLAHAGVSFSLGKTEASAGEPVPIALVWINDSDAPLTPQWPTAALLNEGSVSQRTVLDCDAPSAETLPAGTFARQTCRLTLPDGFNRLAAVRLEGLDSAPALLAIQAKPGASVLPETPTAEAEPLLLKTTNAPLDIFRSAISSYEPMYFSVGDRGRTNAKFQISLKFRLLRPYDFASTGRRIADDIYLGYTQTTLWDLEGDSKPFFDTAYRPSLFYAKDTLATWGKRATFGLATGVEHESNGKSGLESRSLNTVFVTPMLRYRFGSDYMLGLAPKLYAYLDKEENPDIDDFRGHGDYLVRLEREGSWRLDTTARRGNKKNSVQLDFSYPLRWVSLGNLNGYLHLQYFNGYGETLRTYNERLDSQLRLGLMLVR